MSRESAPSDASSLDAAIAAFFDAFNALDWERFYTLFADDATVFHPVLRAQLATTPAEVAETWRAVFDAIRRRSGRTEPPYQELQTRVRDRHIQWLGDIAILTFHLSGTETLGRRTLVWRCDGDGWRIVHLHASNRQLA